MTTEASDASIPSLTPAELPAPVASEQIAAASEAGGIRKRILAAAAIIMVGQLLGSALGFVRIEALNVLFYPIASGAFVVALRPVQMLSDLLVGGSVSGALIPTFVDHGGEHQRDELRHIYSTIVNVVLIVMSMAAVVLFVTAPAFIPLLTAGYSAQGQQLTITLTRIAAFSLLGLGLYAATSALLYALKEVVFPAFATGMYHIGVVVCGVGALLLAAHQLGLPLGDVLRHTPASSLAGQARVLSARGLAVGAVIGAAGEFLILLPGLRRARIVWRPVLDLRHPAVRQIMRLYAPIAAGLLISLGQQFLDASLASRTPGGAEKNVTALASGTVLTQFPIGLVAAALSFAVLPALTAAASRNDVDEFKRTLRLGFRLGLLLMVPAMVGLIVLRMPIVEMLFQHGSCDHGCSVRNALALQNYAYQLPFIAIDQLLIAAFYALVAIPFGGTIGLPAIAFANTALNSAHAIILFILLLLVIGNFGMRDLLSGTARILLAAVAMGLICWAGLQLLPEWLPVAFDLATVKGQLLTFVFAGALGSLAYFGLVNVLGVEEVRLVGNIVRSKLLGRR